MSAKIWANSIQKNDTNNNYTKECADKQLLPNQLGGIILDLEIECDSQTISKQKIVSLIQLYASAIQYYEQLGSEKYKYFEKRIHNLLLKPVVQSSLKGESTILSYKKQLIKKYKLEAGVNSKQEVSKIIQNSDHQAQKKKKQINTCMKTQEKTLENRINRRKSMSNKSSRGSIADFNDLNIQDIRTGINQQAQSCFILTDIKNENCKRIFI